MPDEWRDMAMLQIDDALDDFRKYQKNITADKKALDASKDKKAVSIELDKVIKKLEPLVKEQDELDKLMKNAAKLKDKLAAFNKEQHAMMAEAKSLAALCKAIKPADDTKGKDFAAIAADATQLQALNELEDLY
jgi:uncharacterized protein (DUF3084 family)